MDQKRGKESSRASSKRQKTAPAVGDDGVAEHHTTSKTAHKQVQPAVPTSNTTRRPFFGVIDNVSSFSGVIEGPYDFGFAISITVDRQTFKGVVYKSNPDHNPETAFPDEEVMINFAASVNPSGAGGSRNTSNTTKSTKTNASQEEVRLPDITTFHFQDGSRHGVHEPPRTPHDSPRTPHAPHTPHDIPRTPLDSPSPKDDHHSDTDEHHTSQAPSTSHPPHFTHQLSPSSSFTHPHHDDQLPAIHSVLQGINNLPPSGTFSPPSTQSHHSSAPTTTTSPPPLPPQPQLQRQKQRQKKRQEKKLMELQQQQPARYQSLLDREKSKIPLLGDESLVHAGMEILQHIGEQRH